MRRFLAWLAALTALFVASCTAPVPPAPTAEVSTAAPVAVERRLSAAADVGGRIGTAWGEDIGSRARRENLRRISAAPLSVTVLPYSASPAAGPRVPEILTANGMVSMRVLNGRGGAWPIHLAGGQPRLQGRVGERYVLEYRNRSRSQTYEIVATVDGLDVLNGRPGSYRNRGHVLAPGQTLRIEGFRRSAAEVAAFRFSPVADSYAANTPAGSIANVGVIGTAVFALDAPPAPQAFPGQRYAPPPFHARPD